MYIPGISDLYKVIRDIVLKNEHNSADEFAWLDKVFGVEA